jgi:hypothetical protein
MAQRTKKKKDRTKTRRPRQARLPGMENTSIPAIDAAAAEYVDARDNRMRLLKEEIEASDKLLALMKEHKQDTYHYDGCTVKVLSKTKVSVKRDKEESNGDITLTEE